MRLQEKIKVAWAALLLAGCVWRDEPAAFPPPIRPEVHFDESVPQLAFAAREIERAGSPIRVFLSIDSGLEPQSYRLRKMGENEWRVTGGDAVGAMYGGLDIAESIRIGITLSDAARSPSIARRGIKFNIPLDARTPSYDDSGDAAQANIEHMWDFGFWEEFFDDMARARYNVITFWNPHPFPSMVKLRNYPDVALQDVCVTTLKPTYVHGTWGEHMGVSELVLKNLRVIKKLSIDEKVEFWRRVMRRAKERGIDVTFITWNVIVNGAEGKHGITKAQDNPQTIEYLRACASEFIRTYPDLTGIGVTAGENMQDRKDEFSKEKWLFKSYGQGVQEARRPVNFIHRVWQTRVSEIVQEFKEIPFDLEFKYARARLYSSPRPPFAQELCREMEPFKLKCWWNLRNDDIFCFRWGDPEYVREFLSNLPPKPLTAGYCVGSDGYVWGREFTSLDPDTPRQLEIRKHWYAFMLWGRLGYDLSLDKNFFIRVLDGRFPGTPLYDAWARASKVIPLVNRFHWRDWDFQWAVEGCQDQAKGFHTVRDFISTKPMQGSGLVSISDYVAGKTDGATPDKVAEELRGHAGEALRLVSEIRRADIGKELRFTLGDIEAMSHLGNYYASKILGAVDLAAKRKDAAIRHLSEAVGHWERYASIATKQYRPQLLARVRDLDWLRLLEDVKKDVDIARTAGD